MAVSLTLSPNEAREHVNGHAHGAVVADHPAVSEFVDAVLAEKVLRPLTHTSRAWLLWLGALLVLVGAGLVAYANQFRNGLAVTGMRDTVIWGLYISNFVFFSGVSMAGTFISAILRLTGAGWRRPLTRISELTTVSALLMCGLMPMVDLGRPDRMLNLFQYGRLMSPIVWDMIAITTYLTASVIYLYLFLIPDAALIRDRLGAGTTRFSKLRHRLYCIVALRWQDLPAQRRRLERGATVMMLIIVPIGITVHSVVSWIFGMTFRAGWSSAIFAPYFAVGALYSGVAMLITLMFIFRRAYHLEAYFTERHFRYLGYLLAAFGVLYLYFTFAEYLPMAYKLEAGDRSLLESLFVGDYAYLVWPGFFGGQILPILMVAATAWFARKRTISVLFAASILVNIGMWIKRFVIVVPSLSVPLMPTLWGIYTPTWVELVLTLATFGGFALTFTLFAKLFPVVSLWEMAEGAAEAHEKGATVQVAADLAPVRPAARLGTVVPAVGLAALLLAGSAAWARPASAQSADPLKLRVEITDTGFNGKPELTLEVDQGRLVELTFVWAHQGYVNEEHVISLDGYKVETTEINSKQRESTLKFVADKDGTFNFKCTEECELHNHLQKGYVKVRPAGGGAAARTPTTLAITPSSKTAGDSLINFMAVLKDQKGAPVSKATVTFYEDAEFVGATSKMALGTAKTDERGVAFLDYMPTLDRPTHVITAQFDGQGVYAESKQSVELKQSGPPASAFVADHGGLTGLRDWGQTGLAAVVTAVWLTLAFVVFQIAGVTWQLPWKHRMSDHAATH